MVAFGGAVFDTFCINAARYGRLLFNITEDLLFYSPYCDILFDEYLYSYDAEKGK